MRELMNVKIEPHTQRRGEPTCSPGYQKATGKRYHSKLSVGSPEFAPSNYGPRAKKFAFYHGNHTNHKNHSSDKIASLPNNHYLGPKQKFII